MVCNCEGPYRTLAAGPVVRPERKDTMEMIGACTCSNALTKRKGSFFSCLLLTAIFGCLGHVLVTISISFHPHTSGRTTLWIKRTQASKQAYYSVSPAGLLLAQ